MSDTNSRAADISDRVNHEIEIILTPELAAVLVNEALSDFGLSLAAGSRQRFIDRVYNAILSGQLKPSESHYQQQFTDLFDAFVAEGNVPDWIEEFQRRESNRGILSEDRLTDKVKAGMRDFLLSKGELVNASVAATPYNNKRGHLHDAYHTAALKSEGRDDPIDAVRRGESVATWDFEIDTFEDIDDQSVISENIRAAGALFYLFYMCERVGLLRVADALVLNWAAGAIDVVDGDGADKLYGFWKKRDERLSKEERALVYTRVLNQGGGKTLNRMAVNEHFPALWQKLMSEVASYIKKSEEARYLDERSVVSRKGIEIAAQELQYNLTEYATGMVHMQTREIYALYQDAIAILQDDQVLSHFGGRGRNNMWKVIERISQDEFGRAPNLSGLRTMAVDGYNVFKWLETTNIQNDELFADFLQAAEAWIIAASSEEDTFDEEAPMDGELQFDDEEQAFFDEEDDELFAA